MPRRVEMSENEYCILNALANKPLYGYAIRKEIERLTEGKKKLSLATLYDALNRLFQEQLIQRKGEKVVQGRVRVDYSITPAGRKALQERFNTIEMLYNICRPQVAEGGA